MATSSKKQKQHQPIVQLIKLAPNLLLVIGVLMLIVGAIEFNQSRQPVHAAGKGDLAAEASNLLERKLAVEQAIRNGQKTYTYSSNFIPGIGRVNSSPELQQQLQQGLKNQALSKTP